MESQGILKQGSLALAQKQARAMRKEPLLQTQCFWNAVKQGAGINLDLHLPDPTQPSVAENSSALLDRGAWVVLSDGEPKQLSSSNGHESWFCSSSVGMLQRN